MTESSTDLTLVEEPRSPSGDLDQTGDADDSMRRKTVRGTFYSVVGQAAKNIIRLGSNILLTRLLTSEDFGLSTLVNTVIVGLEMISDLGIETSIVQRDDAEEERFLDTAFSVQALRGVVLFVLACLLAWPASIFFDSEPLRVLLPVAATGALVRGVWPTRLHLLKRHLEVKKLVSIEIGSQLVSVTAMAIYAYVFRSVWALILGSVTFFVIPVVIAQFMSGHRNRFRWEPSAVRELVGFGKWIFLSTMITFGANYFNIFASGRLVDKSTLGVYGISTMLATLPLLIGSHATNAVLLPALSATVRDSRDKLAGAFERAQSVILPILLFITLGLVLLAPAFFYLIYTEEYHDAGWMLQLGMPGVWFFFMQDAWCRALLALGISRPLAIANGAKLVGTVGLALGGYWAFDFPGLILGGSLGAIGGYAAIVLALSKEGLPAWKKDALYTGSALLLSAVGLLVPTQLAPLLGFEDWRPLSVATSLLVLLPVGYFSFTRLWPEIRGRK